MRKSRIFIFALGVGIASIAPCAAGSDESRLDSARAIAVPREFGTDSYTVTTVSALDFVPDASGRNWATSGSLGRYGEINTDQHFYATLQIPAGATVDYLGVNNLNDNTPGVITARLYQRNSQGNLTLWATVPNTAHDDWDTDSNFTPIGMTWLGNGGGFGGRVLILDLEIASSPNLQYFGWVEVRWKRTVSPAPASPTFNDVPVDDPAFQYVEALSQSGITAGCGGGNFCPDAALTRRQMAVFLSKALGLHWPR